MPFRLRAGGESALSLAKTSLRETRRAPLALALSRPPDSPRGSGTIAGVPDSLHVPVAVRAAVGSRTFERVRLGRSGAVVYRLRGASTLYLKIASARTGSLRDERNRLLWIGPRLPVPEVVAFAEEHDAAYLVTTALPGRPASEPRSADERRRVAWAIGAALRRVHALPVAGCPHRADPDTLLAVARRNVAHGTVDARDFDAERRGRRPEDVLAEAERTRPPDPVATVFVHGDACLPNFVVGHGLPPGIVDWSRCGVGDPARDLALALRSLEWNHGPAHAAALLEAYGNDARDLGRDRWEWNRLLDELI